MQAVGHSQGLELFRTMSLCRRAVEVLINQAMVPEQFSELGGALVSVKSLKSYGL